MPGLKKTLQIIIAGCFFVLSLSSASTQAPKDDEKSDKFINQLYHRLHHKLKSDVALRADIFSAQFLGKPYLLGALGEGITAPYDQFPLYRTDAFDCETLVDTVLALTFSNGFNQFKQCINQIRYREGKPSYISRNHFAELDWNQNNQQKKFIKDITDTFRNESNQPVAQDAIAIIDKPSWYEHMTVENLHLGNMSMDEKTKRLELLKQEGRQLTVSTSRIPYLPLSELFNSSEKANNYLFNQIPNGAIIEIVRPNWDLTKEIGTHLNVSHLGFAFWKNNTLWFREASSNHHMVIDVPLIEYLREALKSPTIKGINVQILLPQNSAPGDRGCGG